MRSRRLGLAIVSSMLVLRPGPALAQAPSQDPPDLSNLSLEQLAELDIVYAASKHFQSRREAPSSVSVVGSEEIRQFGYRTLADVLRSLPGFYVTDDRNYSYVGVRGFNRPGDYSTRVLLLLDGLRTNDNVYDMAFVAGEFMLDADLIDRIEVIRGPGGSIYGSNAFFAVINVVTRRGHHLDGVELAAAAGSFGSHSERASWGQRFANGLEAVVSATLSDRAGERIYFREFDTPETNRGIADELDGEGSDGEHASLSLKGGFLSVSHQSRAKGLSTGAYESDFGDPRNRTRDEKTMAQIGYDGPLARGLSTVARLHYGRYRYKGEYVYGGLPTLDLGHGEWWGVDGSGSWAASVRHLVTFGVEYQENLHQDQAAFDLDPFVVQQDSHRRSTRSGVFVQDEVRLADDAHLFAGLRRDSYQTFGGHTSPRLGLVWEAGEATTLKLLYGTAFRAPNEYELHYSAYEYVANPSLEPETIRTFEAIVERQLGAVRLSGSAFQNRVARLISFNADPEVSQFRNAQDTESRGLELGVEARRGGLSGRASYSLQRTQDIGTDAELTNSPRHMAKLNLAWPLVPGLSAAVDAQYMSARRTLAGHAVEGFGLANFTLRAPRLFGRIDASASVYNLFDGRYSDPGSEEHRQDAIPQSPRSFRLKLVARF